MNKTKEIWMTGFALFSLFFGAGNLILPPSLGVKSGFDWWIVVLGFACTAVVIPIFAIYAHSKLQGTLFDFGKKVSPLFSSVFCFLIYIISISIPSPRTAAVTHEMAVQPNWEISPIVTSIIYFSLVYVFAINRSKILSIIGKYLTPIIGLIIIAIVAKSVFLDPETYSESTFSVPFIDGFLEGYQTFDAIGGVVVGAVIVISLQLRGHTTFEAKKEIIQKAGIIAGTGLLLIYGGLVLSGFLTSSWFETSASRTEILTGISKLTLGNLGTSFLSVLVSLACFTTAVGIVTGASDYVRGISNNSNKAFRITAFVGCLIGVIVGSFQVDFIITLAVPALMFLYPITIVLILLNSIPEKYASAFVFRGVVFTAFLFSIPDFLSFIIDKELLEGVFAVIPLASFNLGWVLPSVLALILTNIYIFNRKARISN
ncbi:MAG: branched-chain amino acid transport system II carrier protein [Flavobacteriaceae bacterium]|nr:branched-chain amino acid transport system II carrier protein [Flavobacteriaceae bacterium]|tara:strand:+ start:376281 stop:377567 length:1287 start_codon:yes stop_codon:yes gene_type:complete